MPSFRDSDCEDPAAALEQALAELDAAAAANRAASQASLRTSEQFTRVVRAAKPSRSDPAMRAVTVVQDDADITSTFRALRRAL